MITLKKKIARLHESQVDELSATLRAAEVKHQARNHNDELFMFVYPTTIEQRIAASRILK